MDQFDLLELCQKIAEKFDAVAVWSLNGNIIEFEKDEIKAYTHVNVTYVLEDWNSWCMGLSFKDEFVYALEQELRLELTEELPEWTIQQEITKEINIQIVEQIRSNINNHSPIK